MALLSPANLLTLHYSVANQIKNLKTAPSRRYQYADCSSKYQVTTIPDPSLFDPSPSQDAANGHAAIDHKTWEYTLEGDHKEWLFIFDIDPNIVEAVAEAGKTTVHVPNGDLGPLFGTLRHARGSQTTTGQLVENVERQGVFVDKVHAHRWIRSPAVDGTLRRAVDRYDKFLHLFRLYPGQFLVLTLDVDLVWHTHRCSAAKYRAEIDRTIRFKLSPPHVDHTQPTSHIALLTKKADIFYAYPAYPRFSLHWVRAQGSEIANNGPGTRKPNGRPSGPPYVMPLGIPITTTFPARTRR
ncbi:uncharacterized protein BDV17DRAFT_286926 [Aspergillus undulatus]|uniref:uncharacterized protein n=1 Tax=Aspergillus undulatus TaxID=1810928 RepID=UPI003CCE09F7